MKTTVIHHSADFDGIFCREIARKFLPDAELIGWDFGQPKISNPLDGLTYVLDLSPECLNYVDGTKLIWIDHHKTSIEKWPSDIPGYRIDGVAACRLAWQWFIKGDELPNKDDYFHRLVKEPLAVRLAGEYDIWDKRDPRAEVFQFGLRSRELSDFDWRQMFSTERPTIEEVKKLIDVGHQGILEPDGTTVPAIVCGLLENGRILQAYQQRNDAGMMHKSYIVEWEGLKFLTINTARFNSLTFASKDVPETGHDALLGYVFNGTKWTVSLYHAKHRMDIDLSQIAIKHGGGGHKGACGFTTDKLPFLPC